MLWIKQLTDSLRRLLTAKSRVGCYRIRHSEAFEQAYRNWVENRAYLHLAHGIFKAYHFRKCQINSPFRLQLIEEPNRRGLLLFYHPAIGRDNFRFLVEFIKDKALALGYRLYLSDERVLAQERYTETITKHYLKPPAEDAPNCLVCNQRYGNIIIDLVSINTQPGYLRFYVNSFTNPYFSKPLPFEELLERVFSGEGPTA